MRIIKHDPKQSFSQLQSAFERINVSGDARVHIGHHFGNSGNARSHRKLADVGRPFTVPFGRDPRYVPRGDIMERLQACINPAEHSRMALTGLGGVG